MPRRMTEEEINKEVAQMSDVMEWPQMHLPVYNIHDEDRRYGIILHTIKHPYDVFEVNQFAMGPVIEALTAGKTPSCNVYHYESFDAVVRDGWVGD